MKEREARTIYRHSTIAVDMTLRGDNVDIIRTTTTIQTLYSERQPIRGTFINAMEVTTNENKLYIYLEEVTLLINFYYYFWLVCYYFDKL